jgi:hypothetical protein
MPQHDDRSFPIRAISAIEKAGFLDEPITRKVEFDETSWAVGTVTDEALERVSYFLDTITRRAPMAQGPGWAAHRQVIEAFVSDLRRELTRREVKDASGD